MRLLGSFVALAAETMLKHRAAPNTIATERTVRLAVRSEHLMCSSPLSVLVMSNPFLFVLVRTVFLNSLNALLHLDMSQSKSMGNPHH
jgi:hypothetical protein